MKILSFSFLAVSFVFLTGCGGPSGNEEFVQPPVGVLDTGDFLLTLHSSPEGPLYTLEKDGELIARELSRSEFVAQFPELKEQIGVLWAGNEGGKFRSDELTRPVFENLLQEPGVE